ncbi:hypothetical protein LCGC14_1939910 [marine sediment metagenome]|uniref:Uncharacterized protein n=1 Tax=marine sediment metagenome TaxID=412755 RepID=A0A0F9G932_9ZZZZ
MIDKRGSFQMFFAGIFIVLYAIFETEILLPLSVWMMAIAIWLNQRVS